MAEGSGAGEEVALPEGCVVEEIVAVHVIVVMHGEAAMVGRLVGHPDLIEVERTAMEFYPRIIVDHVAPRVEDGELQLLDGEVDVAFPQLDVDHSPFVMVEELVVEYGQLRVELFLTVALLTVILKGEKSDLDNREYGHYHQE